MAYKFQRGSAILSGALLQEGNVELASGFEVVIGNASLTEAELEMLDGVSAGTVAASKVVVVDSNKDADGFRNVGAAQLTTSGRVIVDDATEATSTTDGSLQTDGGLSVAKSAVIGDDLDMLSDAAILNFGADKDVNLTHVADTGLLLNSSMQMQFGDSGTYIHQSADGVLDLVADSEIEINATTIDINGAVDASSTITAAGRIIVDDATEATSTTDGSLQTDGGLSVAKSAVIGDDLDMLSDAAILNFGADKDVSLTHVADTGLLLNSSRQLQFGDSGTYIHQSADGVLDLVADTEIEINATTVDINGAIDASSTIVAASSITAGTSFVIGSADLNETDMEKLDGITNGTVAANKAVVVDANKDASGFRKISVSGSSSDELIIGSGTNRSIGVVIDGSDDFFRMGHAGGAVVLSASSGVEFVGGDEGVGSFGSDIKVYATQAGSTTNVELSAAGVISGSSKLEIGGTVQFDGVADNAMVIADSLYYFDATDNKMKRDLASDVRNLFFSAVSGDATIAAGGALTIAAGAVEHGMLAEDIISGQAALGGATVAQADLLMLDDGPGTVKKVTFSNFEDSIFGNISGDASVAAGGALTIANDAVESGMLNDNVISGQTELAADGLAAADELLISDGGTLKKIGVDNLFLDGPGLLGEAAVTVADDYIMFLDGGATGDAKKESVADLVSAMAGAGLSATNGVLAVQGNSVALKADGDTLAEGYNYFANISASNVGVDLPASPSVGDVVTVKAGNITNSRVLRISAQGSHTIDGESTIDLESPYAAVTLVYVVADNWRVV